MTKNDPILQGASGYQIPSSKNLSKGWGEGTKQQKEARMAENMSQKKTSLENCMKEETMIHLTK